MTMKDHSVVVVYGSSLFSKGIEVSLKGMGAFNVVQIDTALPDAEEHLKLLNPDVIVVDITALHWHVAMSFLLKYPKKPLIGLDLHSNHALIMSGQCSSVNSMQDLVSMIENETAALAHPQALESG